MWDGVHRDLTAALNGCSQPPADVFGSPVAVTRSTQPLAASPAASQLRAALQDANEAVAAAKANGTVRSAECAGWTRLAACRPTLTPPAPAGAQTPSRGEFSRLRHSMSELAAENTRLSLALAQAQADAGRAKGGALVQAREEMRALADEQARSMADATALIAELTALLRRDLRAVEGPASAGMVDAGECWPAAAPSARRSGQRPAPGSVLGLAADLHGTVHKAACVRRAVRFAASAAAAQAQHAAAAVPSPMATAGVTATPPSSKRAKKFASASPMQAQRVACSPLNMR